MTRGCGRLAAASVVAAVLAAAGVGPAAAGVAPAAAGDDALSTTWEGPAVHLRPDGSTYSTSSTSFLGTLVAVPGDVVGRTLTVRNDGPGDATLRGWVTDVRLLDPDASDVDRRTGADRGDFYADLTLTWRTASGDGAASFRALAAAGRTPVVEVPLAQGGTTRITLVSELPLDATSGNAANVAPREARFDVLLRLDGTAPDASASPAPAPSPTAPAAGATGGGTRVGAQAGWADGPLATTGADALRLALGAVTAVGVGGLLLGAVRRRRDEPRATQER